MDDPKLDWKLNRAKLEKLELEVKDLRSNMTGAIRIARFVPTVSALIAVAAFLLGIYTVHIQNMKENDIKEKEFKRVFWEKQLETYRDLSNCAARLATLEDAGDRKKEYQHFKELYHGNVVMVMDDNVAMALKNFAEQYIDYQNNPGNQVKVMEASRVLTKACRDSVRYSWNVPLKDIDLTKY